MRFMLNKVFNKSLKYIIWTFSDKFVIQFELWQVSLGGKAKKYVKSWKIKESNIKSDPLPLSCILLGLHSTTTENKNDLRNQIHNGSSLFFNGSSIATTSNRIERNVTNYNKLKMWTSKTHLSVVTAFKISSYKLSMSLLLFCSLLRRRHEN